MGLQILLADIPPPARIRDDSAPPPPARDLASRFDGYLNDARSTIDAEPAAQSPEAPRPDVEPPTDVEEIDPGAAPLADQAEEPTDDESPGVTSPSIAIGPELYIPKPNDVEPSAEPSPFPKQQPTDITSRLPVEPTEQGSSQPAPANSPQQVEMPSREAKVSGDNVEQPVNQNTRSATTSENTAQSGRTATRTVPDQLTPVRDLVDAPSQQQQNATDQSRAREEAVGPRQPSPAQLSNQPAPDQSRARKETLGTQPQSSTSHPTRFASDQDRARKEAVRTTIPVRSPVTIKAGEGDGAAASFAKFLITAGNQNGSGSPSDVAAPTSAGGIGQVAGSVASTAGADQAPVANLVADLLAARVDAADAIKGAARVLNASGRSGKFEVTMQLDPPELGQLKLQIQMRQQGLILRVDAQTQAVAKLIESRLTELSDALALHGIRVDRAEVTVRPAASTQADTQSPQDKGPSNHGDFNQASTQDQDGSDQGEAASYQTADQHLSDPKHPVEDLDGGSYQDDLTAPAQHGADFNDANMPTTESSVNLVA